MADENFSDLGRIEAVARLYDGTPFRPFPATRFEAAARDSVVPASRLFLEGIDFNLVYFPLKHLGYKAVVAVTGALYAELARPQSLTVRLGLSAKLDFAQTKELWSGMVAAAREHGYKAVDLDLAPSRNGLAISVTATGLTRFLTAKSRPKPQSKDLLCLSGNLGGAFFGLQVLERARRLYEADGTQPALEKYRMMVGSYLKPELSAGIVDQLEETEIYPSCGVLVTHGLADAVKRIVRETGLGAKVYTDKIPFEGNTFDLGRELDIDPVSAAMNGGEDYRLLFTVPIIKLERFRHDFQTFDIVGHLAQPEVGAVLVTPEGAELPLRAPGWKED